jgi:hypothetical protein
MLLEGCLAIYEKIYLPSLSAARPSDDAIKERLKDINSQLLKEYLKSGELLNAKKLLGNVQEPLGFNDDWKLLLCKALTKLPFNVVSYMVASKRALWGG